jgi:hypothetical protein
MKNNSKNKIQDFLKPEIKLFLSDINNFIKREHYDKKRKYKCTFCKRTIEKNSFPDHLLLWNKNQTYFVYLHLKCAFREDIKEDINVILKDFDYIYEV